MKINFNLKYKSSRLKIKMMILIEFNQKELKQIKIKLTHQISNKKLKYNNKSKKLYQMFQLQIKINNNYHLNNFNYQIKTKKCFKK